MTSAEFLANDDLVKSWRDTYATLEILRIVLQICDEEGPLRDEKPHKDTMVQYGRVLGHDEYAKKLKSLTILSEVKPQPKRSYGVKPNALTIGS